jgi:cytochrome P450
MLPTRRETLTLSNARAFSSRGPAFLAEIAGTLGPNFRLGVGPVTLTFLAEPEAVQHVLQKRAPVWGRGASVDGIRPLLGNGLPMSDPPLWLTQRRTMQPSFHKANGPKWVDVIRDTATAHLDALKPGQAINTRQMMITITRDVIVRAMFSHSMDLDLKKVDDALTTVEDFIATTAFALIPLPMWLPTPMKRRFNAAVEYLTMRLQNVIDERRRMADPPSDLLTMLLNARDPETGAAMSDKQLRDEVMNIFFAGHETTANLLTWATLALDRYPQVRERAEAEVATVLQGRPPNKDDIPNLKWLGLLSREVLRVYPPAWMYVRQALEPDEVAGQQFQPGDVVMVSPYVTHHLPQYWSDPERFDPQRFENEQGIDAAVWKYRYWPFGGGPHVCIGNHFAMLEAVTVLALMLQRGRFDVVERGTVKPKVGATLTVAGGLPTRFSPRASA